MTCTQFLVLLWIWDVITFVLGLSVLDPVAVELFLLIKEFRQSVDVNDFYKGIVSCAIHAERTVLHEIKDGTTVPPLNYTSEYEQYITKVRIESYR